MKHPLDLRIVLAADRLLEAGHITPQERAGLVTDTAGVIVDDTAFPVDVCDNGDVYVHNRGSYPLILTGHAPALS